MVKISRLALIGFGQAAKQLLASGLNCHNRIITVFDRSVLNPETRKSQLQQYIHYNLQGCISLRDAIHSTHLILILTDEQDNDLLPELCDTIQTGQIIIDLRTNDWQQKQPYAHPLEAQGAVYLSGQIDSRQKSNEVLRIYCQQIELMSQMVKSLDLDVDLISHDEANFSACSGK